MNRGTKMPCVSPLLGYKHVDGSWRSKRDNTIGKMSVKCGQCIGCRTARRKEWAARIMHEASQYKTNSFLTLTYREKCDCSKNQLRDGLHIPEDFSLVKKHHQDFMKRLRKHFKGRRIRYYQCGEYGDDNNRPHYHSALFNLAFDDEQFYSHNYGNPLFTSQTLEEVWSYGFATIGNLSFQSASYVAGYILKKITGARADDHYLRNDERGNAYWLQPEYATMSTGAKKGDGLGADWLKLYHEDVFPSDDLPVPGVGIVRGIPRYYEELQEQINPQSLEEAKQIRSQFARSHPELFTAGHLKSQYKIYKANMRKREL